MADEKKRIINETTDAALASSGDYVIVDSQTEGTRKFDLGAALAAEVTARDTAIAAEASARSAADSQLQEDLGDLDDLETTDKSNLVAAINEANSGGGLDEEAQELLIDILTNAVYTSDQSSNISALEYQMSGGKTKYTITYNLNGASSSNTKKKAFAGSSYSSEITAITGYVLQTVIVVMGGVDVTSSVYSNGQISIASVTGDITITATGDVVMTTLKSINLANGAYVDTEYLIQDMNERYVIGVQLMTSSPGTTYKAFAGVSRRPSSTTSPDNYLQMHFGLGNESNNHSMQFQIGAHRAPSVAAIQLRTANGNYAASAIDTVPFYYSAKSGEQLLKANEDLTENLTTGTWATVSNTTGFPAVTADMPIDPIYLGTINNAGDGTVAAYTDGVKIFCFKVYDSNNNLVVNMHPAIRGSAIGMYDSVRATFYEAENGVVGTDITYDEMEVSA